MPILRFSSIWNWFKKKRPAPPQVRFPPVHTVPTELLAEIFSHCSRTHTQLPLSSLDRFHDAKFDILHADLSVSQPVHIRASQDEDVTILNRFSESLGLWLNFSDTQPLTLRLDGLDWQVITPLLPHLRRCKSLSLVVDGDSRNMLYILSQSLDQLEIFSLQTGSDIYEEIFDYIGFLAFYELHWRNLRVLNWDCANILKIDGAIVDDDIQVWHSNIELLDITADDDAFKPLSFFTLPSLKQLCLTSRGTTSHRSYDSLDALVQRSACQIQYLSVSEVMSLDDYAGYITLPCLQGVEVLNITSTGIYTGITDRTLELLRYPVKGNTQGYMPHLRSLELRNLVSTDGQLGSLVNSRYNQRKGWNTMPARLEDVCAEFALFPSPPTEDEMFPRPPFKLHREDYAVLQSLAEDGLDVQLFFDRNRLGAQ
ncbi:hypothetical protein C0995_008130 [Termitomyces sp. Mi166|nr:hypothetical protein C0995_008130 [Termitomyces sp. Mi166\